MKVIIDLDGVLVDFVGGIRERAKTLFNIDLPAESDSYPDVWEYLKRDLGEEHNRKLWESILVDHSFWLKLKPRDTELLARLASVETSHEFYFVTSRPGVGVKFQTEVWLIKYFHLPTVIIANGAQAKADIARGVEADVFIDDNAENCNLAVEAREGKMAVLMPDRPYNRNVIVDARVVRSRALKKTLGRVLNWEMAA